jgi:hypothetical protein
MKSEDRRYGRTSPGHVADIIRTVRYAAVPAELDDAATFAAAEVFVDIGRQADGA